MAVFGIIGQRYSPGERPAAMKDSAVLVSRMSRTRILSIITLLSRLQGPLISLINVPFPRSASANV